MRHLVLGLILLSFSFQAQSGLIGDELKKLGASFSENFAASDPGSFVSKSRSGVSGGTIRKRIPRTNVQLISITPAKITGGGCAGIDIHFGSFSFINGDQIRQLLSSYLQGVVGLAFTMAIDQGCPVCAKAMHAMSEMANYANSLNVDSCQMAQGTMDAIFDEQSEACAGLDADSGGATDRSESKDSGGTCGSLKSPSEIVANLGAQLDCSKSPSGAATPTADEIQQCEEARTKQMKVWGNTTVHYLKETGVLSKKTSDWEASDYWKAELYSATLGTHYNGIYMERSLSPADVLDVVMCGVDPLPDLTKVTDAAKKAVLTKTKNVCEGFLSTVGDININFCADPDCKVFETQTLVDWVDDNSQLVGEGFPIQAQGLLRVIGDTIESMEKKASDGDEEFNGFEMHLLDTAPFPLYRLINLSAFYPNAASELLGDNSHALAFLYSKGMVESLFENVYTVRHTNNASAEGLLIRPGMEIADRITEKSKEVAYKATDYATSDNVAWKANTALTRQILSLEKSLLQSNLSKGLNGLGLN